MEEDEKNWYVVHTYSGYEERTKENLEHRVELENLAHGIRKNAGVIHDRCEPEPELKHYTYRLPDVTVEHVDCSQKHAGANGKCLLEGE